MIVGQSRRGSAAEAVINVAVGLTVSMIANHFVFPAYGFVPSLAASAQITTIYTAISLVRSYCLRRAFNWFGFRRPSMETRMKTPDCNAPLMGWVRTDLFPPVFSDVLHDFHAWLKEGAEVTTVVSMDGYAAAVSQAATAQMAALRELLTDENYAGAFPSVKAYRAALAAVVTNRMEPAAHE